MFRDYVKELKARESERAYYNGTLECMLCTKNEVTTTLFDSVRQTSSTEKGRGKVCGTVAGDERNKI